VFCQLEILRDCLPPSVRQVLNELPESLDKTYERILENIRNTNQRHVQRLLQCLVAASRPLQVKELAEILAVDFDAEGVPKLNPGWRWADQEKAVMSICSSLVIIVKGDKGSRIVQFSHFTVKEYLTENRLAESIKDVSRYHIRLEAAHTIFAQACLGVLLHLDDRVDRDDIENFPLAQYAAQHWTKHARSTNASSPIRIGMEYLFDADRPQFATWLWIYDEDRDGRSMNTSRPGKPEAVPLYYAAKFGFRDLVKHLIAEHPEHVHARGGVEVTPMHVAATAGHVDILSLLLEHGVYVDGLGIKDQTPLHRASANAKVKTGKFLLDRGADVNARDNDGSTPLFLAAFEEAEFARMLLQHGARINARDNSRGWTPLHQAVYATNIQVVRLLLERGADVNARDTMGKTPSQITRQREMLDLLSEFSTESVE
jgi:ankyrin repeat protein